jgi:integrase
MVRRVYNKVYDEGTWDKVNEKSKLLLDDFILDLRENKKSPSTIKQYFSDLRGFFCHLLREYDNRFVLDLTKRDFKQYSLSLLDDRKLSNARRNCMVASIHSLLEYAELDDDYGYDINAARLVKSLRKEPVRDIVFVSDDDILSLFNRLMSRGDFQIATLLMLSYDSAGRRAELAQVTKNSFLDKSRNNTNTVIGKGRKKFSLVYFDKTKLAASEWLKQRGEDSIDSLFIDSNTCGVTNDNIYRMFCYMRNLINLGGKEDTFSPHSMRHSSLANYKDGTHYVCRSLLNSGFSIDQLKILAHHESVETTLSYLPDIADTELENMFGINIIN